MAALPMEIPARNPSKPDALVLAFHKIILNMNNNLLANCIVNAHPLPEVGAFFYEYFVFRMNLISIMCSLVGKNQCD